VQVHFGLPLAPAASVCLTIGSFDGVHLGHQDVIARTRAAAVSDGVASALITFEPHPRCIVDPANCPNSITTLKEKLELIEALGIEHAVVLEFTREVSTLSPSEFMGRVDAGLDVRRVVSGPDFAFGHKRAGNVGWLREHGYRVDVVPAFRLDGEEVHSSEIRSHLTSGEIERANRLLGREFSLGGIVEVGERIGRTLGFPTANLAIESDKLVPGHGVYAGWVRAPLGEFMAAISIGHRPTFGGTQLRIEAYLLDFDGDLYQQWLEVRFKCRIRGGQLRFDTPSELSEQIAKDVEATRQALSRR
jgi:riboflavin kinase/FMN adenylyltransferase